MQLRTYSSITSQAHREDPTYEASQYEGKADISEAAAVGRAQHKKIQALLVHTARYIAEFDKPPRLLSFTVNVHLMRYIFVPLLSPLLTLLRSCCVNLHLSVSVSGCTRARANAQISSQPPFHPHPCQILHVRVIRRPPRTTEGPPRPNTRSLLS